MDLRGLTYMAAAWAGEKFHPGRSHDRSYLRDSEPGALLIWRMSPVNELIFFAETFLAQSTLDPDLRAAPIKPVSVEKP